MKDINQFPPCIYCGHPTPGEGYTIPAEDDHDVTGAQRARCSDSACVTDEEGSDYCVACNGTGEGQREWMTCQSCKGSGEGRA